jgi:AcrR family transcriptional regulator
MATTDDQRILIVELFKQGDTIKEITNKLNVSYSLVYYHLRSKDLITKVNEFNMQRRSQFNYQEYMEALLCHCCKLRNCNKEELKEFLRTDEGQNFLMRESSKYTPSIHKNIREDL